MSACEPTYKRTPWDEGFDACEANKPETANPYDIRTHEQAHLDWSTGWADAQSNGWDFEPDLDEIDF